LLVRTGLVEVLGKLLEVVPSLDSFSRSIRKAVRSSSEFGQVGGENEKSCTKQHRVRTGYEGKREKLSEAAPSSDRLGGGTRKAVRSSTKFGQVRRGNKKSCPKQHRVQTGWEEEREKLSEVALSSDTL
jgi:hypothetical protein